MSPSARRGAWGWLLGVAVSVAGGNGCAGKPAASPPRTIPLAEVLPLATAFLEADARGDGADDAATKGRALLPKVGALAEESWRVALTAWLIDALATRTSPAFSSLGSVSLADRTENAAGLRSMTPKDLPVRDPIARSLAARGFLAVAERDGDAVTAAEWRAAAGCVHEATVFAAHDFAAVSALEEADPKAFYADARSPLPETMPADIPAAPALAPAKSMGERCMLATDVAGDRAGLRDVIVDADVPAKGWIGVLLVSGDAATVHVGGLAALARPFALGASSAARAARVLVDQGRVRVVVRVASPHRSGHVSLMLLGEDGLPLATHAPSAGERATSAAHEARAIALPTPHDARETALVAHAALALGDPRAAEAVARGPSPPPAVALALGKAFERADDLEAVRRAERARSAYETVLEAWPDAWEAIAAHASLAGRRRGPSEARIEMLRDLATQRRGIASSALDALEAATAYEEHLGDRAEEALARSKAKHIPLLTYAAGNAPRSKVEAVEFACASAIPKDAFDCFSAKDEMGDFAGAREELDRLDVLFGGPTERLERRLQLALEAGDLASARKAYDAMPIGRRSLADGVASGAIQTEAALLAAARTAPDAPGGIPALLPRVGADPFAGTEEMPARIAKLEREHPSALGAATQLLLHEERYDVDPRGLLRVRLFDVRRVGSTTDVEENAQAEPPRIYGHATLRTLRRRIFKKDGRILEPERTPNASQGHADLSQLEPGDAVESMLEGFSVPGGTSTFGFDTPDLLPERTAALLATIEIRLPTEPYGSLSAHPLLGAPTETKEAPKGGLPAMRVLRYTLKEHGVRREEGAMPEMDRPVGVSFTTLTDRATGRALKETIALLSESEPEVTAFAKDAMAKSQGDPVAAVRALTVATGTAIKTATGSPLSIPEIMTGEAAQTTTARTALASHEGSRTWLVARGLRELGISSEIVLVEDEPFSDNPKFPAHSQRFTHPLLVASLPSSEGTSREIWVDSDVEGPPLPAGKISPELRGRKVLHDDGRVTDLPASALGDSGSGDSDEVDLRLTLDRNGDAHGELTLFLRGREARLLAEALTRVVGADRDKMLRNVALGWVPFASVDRVTLSSGEESWQVALRAALTVSAYAQPESSGSRIVRLPGLEPVHGVFPSPFVATLGATYASQGGRESALSIDRAAQYHVHRKIELPAGSTIVRAPGPFAETSQPLTAKRSITTAVAGAPLSVEDEFTLGLATGTVGASAYGRFATAAHKTDDAFLATVQVKLPDAAR